jgi:glycosyltransferase involved in cell wall biosynthesis
MLLKMASAPDADRQLRILVYANVERDEAGGAQAVVRSLRDYLRGRGHKVSSGWNSGIEGKVQNKGEWVGHFPIRQGQRRWLHIPTAARLATRLVRERPDVVNIHFASPSARYFHALAPLFGYQTVLTCHGSDVLRPLPQDAEHLPAIVTGADEVTAVSQDIAARLAENKDGETQLQVTVIPNGVDTRFWHPAAHRPPAHHKTGGQIIAIGRLEPVKGFDLLIDALARLRARGSQATLTLVGDGSQRAALEAQAHTAGIADSVVFAGQLPREEVRAKLHAADLFVLPSRSEGTPLALLEAMATGTACIATCVGGVPASVGEAAWLVSPEDAAALSTAIAHLLAEPKARSALGHAARERACKFSAEETHRAYETVMLNLASELRR